MFFDYTCIGGKIQIDGLGVYQYEDHVGHDDFVDCIGDCIVG